MNNQDSIYRKAEVLIKILPLLSEHPDFAIKGGTAINFFQRDLPRYSIDINLTYLPIQDRHATLSAINTTMLKLKSTLETLSSNLIAYPMIPKGIGTATSLEIAAGEQRIILETNYILRGAVNPPESKQLVPQARTIFGVDFKVQTLSFNDIFAGKLCAALSRQHPRDLFDVKILLENEGITPELKAAFLVYLSSHSRPFHELLDPNPIDLTDSFDKDFMPMNRTSITLEELKETRRLLPPLLHKALKDADRDFLLSMMNLTPKWHLLNVPHAQDLPGIKWKLINLGKMDKNKRKLQTKQLEGVLSKKITT